MGTEKEQTVLRRQKEPSQKNFGNKNQIFVELENFRGYNSGGYKTGQGEMPEMEQQRYGTQRNNTLGGGKFPAFRAGVEQAGM